MRVFLTFLLLCSGLLYGQSIIGTNGTNSPENLTAEVRAYIVALPTDSFGLVFRGDKYQGAKAPVAELDNVVALHNDLRDSGKALFVCYTVYTRTGYSLVNEFWNIDYLLDRGVNIYSVRLGNEEWAKAAGGGKARTFDQYWSFCSPYIPGFVSRGFDRVLIPVERPSEDLTWNTSAAAKINSDWRYHPDYHPYWGPKQASVIDTIGLEEELPFVNTSTYQPFHDWFYRTLYEQVRAYDLIGEIKTWHEANVPGKEYHVTEFGPPTAVGHIGNALGFEATVDWFLREWHSRLGDAAKFTAIFNGPSPTGTAIINPKGKKDDTSIPGTYMRRLKYWTIDSYLRNRNATESLQINSAGDFVISYHNLGADVSAKPISEVVQLGADVVIDTCWWEGIYGQYWYSGSGAVEWWLNGSPKTYEISQVYKSVQVPALSYGYLHVTARAKVWGCVDASALNYNPDADADDGSCFYFSDCGCWDQTATNYNPEAPCQDNTKCEYAPVECLRKRWLFSSLPCKPARSRCNCQ